MIEKIKTKNGYSYRARITWFDGKDAQKTFRRKVDAQDWERAKIQERNRARETGLVVQDSIVFSEFVEKWMNEKVRPQLSKASQVTYELDLRLHILPLLGNLKMRGLSLEHGNWIILSMQKKLRSPRTINSVLGLLQGILNDAVQWKYLHKNPLDGLQLLKEMPPAEVFWLDSEIDQFLRANLRYQKYSLWVVALNTGMRRGELAALKWDRVSFQRRQFDITRSVTRYGLVERTKTGRKRIVPINDAVYQILWPQWQAQKSEFVFCQDDGSPIDVHHVYRDFHRAQARAGLKTRIRFHDLRHTFASHFMMKGGNLYDLQKILGHTSSKMTERYAHLSPTHLENAIQIVSFGGSNAGLPESSQNEPPKNHHFQEANGRRPLVSIS
jgi:integrase